MQKTFPPKFKGLGSFTIPCSIGNHDVGKTLVNLGESINLMPLSMLKKLGDLEIKPTRMTFQLEYRSIKYPYDVAEDVVVKIDKLKFPMDFVVMEMEENTKIPLILGQPFMRTTKVVIHVDDEALTLKDQDEEVTFNVFDDVQLIQAKQTSCKAKDEVLSVIGLPGKATKTVNRNHSCFSLK
ncbi:uncharacterized protein LOC106773419 [Vigna radiata var. radiata]|uniref:Uncharacterized protein LOC106773419 n=1 Tax=Vigna radiata var. radiata TaxID=3916 RepID=A0A1S3VBF8_VIGRR|nr:uncharacterized protein LOC106773419 [Vigna radiata var. radiata]